MVMLVVIMVILTAINGDILMSIHGYLWLLMLINVNDG
jgi:hypothetical protein